MVQNAHCLKVCFFSPASYPLFAKRGDVHGGAELQTYLLAKGLAQDKNIETSVITGNYKQEKIQFIDNIKLIRGFKMNMNDSIILKFIKSLKYFSQLITEKPDIVFTTAAQATVGISALYTILFNKNLIHRTAHSDDVDLSWINKNGIAGKLYKFGLSKATKLITQSKDHQTLLKQNHNLTAEVFRNIFEPSISATQKDGSILWVSRFATWKQPQLFLELAKQIPNSQFIMICPSYGNKNLEWDFFIEKTKSIKNLKFIEQVPFNEIQTYFNDASVFINTSSAEGFPNTFLQAAAGKTPIISLNVNPDNFLNEYNCGYFCKNNAQLLKTYTEQLLTNKDENFLKGTNAFHYINEFHNEEIQIKKFREIINNLNS